MFSLFICIIVNIVFILFYLQVEPVYLRVSNKPIQITSRVINIGNTMTYKTRLPWLTEKLRTQIKEKNVMHTQVILNPGDTLLNSEYKRLRNELTSSLRICELLYYSNKL